jgi:SNF2 family DNA or RNA helicase
VYGDRKQRLAALAKKVDFYILNHDGLGVGTSRQRKLVLGELAMTIRDRADINCVIIDEQSAYKDHTTLRTRILRAVIAEKQFVWGMTGTPTPNAPTDAYSLAKIVRREYLERFEDFRERTMFKLTNFKWAPRPGAKEAVHAALQPAIRFARDECMDLPDCLVPPPIEVELTAAQKAAYDALKKEATAQLESGVRITAVNEGVLRMKLIQIGCGAVYDEHHRAHLIDCAPRLDALDEVIAEAPGKIIVFAPLTSVVHMLYERIRKLFSASLGDAAVEFITGEVSAKRRADIFQAFETGISPRVLVADPGTMAHGVTLVAASDIVWFGPTDRPEIYEQANARPRRAGQRLVLKIHRLASTATEREIYRRLESKISLQGAILEMVREGR